MDGLFVLHAFLSYIAYALWKFSGYMDMRLWIWIYPWISTENLWIWIWIWMGNFISTATLQMSMEGRMVARVDIFVCLCVRHRDTMVNKNKLS